MTLAQQWSDALAASDQAISIYQQLMDKAGSHFAAALGHAECVRAVSKWNIGDYAGSVEDSHRGLERMREALCLYPFEIEIRLQLTMDILAILPSRLEDNTTFLLNDLFVDYKYILSKVDPVSEMGRHRQHVVSVLTNYKVSMEKKGGDTQSLRKFLNEIVNK